MKVRPILFNTGMVRAILRKAGPKTVTRRTIKGYIPQDAIWGYTPFTPKGHISCRGIFVDGYGEKFFKMPCQKGDVLYVREAWSWESCWDCGMDTEEHNCCDKSAYKIFKHDKKEYGCYIYKASFDDSTYPSSGKWRPSIHMPKEAARIWLKVTDVRVERLQDITNKQILKEGTNRSAINHLINQMPEKSEEYIRTAYMVEYSWLWDSTIKTKNIALYGWEANPWVWVIEFEHCEKPEDI